MNTNRQYKSDALAAIHETMSALYKIGAIDSMTIQKFDQDCLEPIMTSVLDSALDERKSEYVTLPYTSVTPPTYPLGVGVR